RAAVGQGAAGWSPCGGSGLRLLGGRSTVRSRSSGGGGRGGRPLGRGARGTGAHPPGARTGRRTRGHRETSRRGRSALASAVGGGSGVGGAAARRGTAVGPRPDGGRPWGACGPPSCWTVRTAASRRGAGGG